MSWCYDGRRLPRFELKGELDPDVKIEGQEEGPSVACFKISSSGPVWSDKIGFRSDKEREEAIFKAINYRDRLFWKRWEVGTERDFAAGHRLYITIPGSTAESCYVNDPDVP
jgi:hypothetical protein